MCFQRDMRLPIDNEVISSSDVENADNDIDQTIQALLSSREKSFKDVQANITNAQAKQKETYDRKHLPDILPKGTMVLLEMEPLWLGPYVVNRDIGKGLYELKNDKGTIMKTKANIKRLKVYKKGKQSLTGKYPYIDVQSRHACMHIAIHDMANSLQSGHPKHLSVQPLTQMHVMLPSFPLYM